MAVTSSIRMVRGGKAVQTVYWRMVDKNATPKLIKHGRIFSIRGPRQDQFPVMLQNRSFRF